MLSAKNNKTFKIISVLFILIFFWNQIVWAAGTPLISSKPSSQLMPADLANSYSAKKSEIARLNSIESFGLQSSSSVQETPNGTKYDDFKELSNGTIEYYLNDIIRESLQTNGTYTLFHYDDQEEYTGKSIFNTDNSESHYDAEGRLTKRVYSNGYSYEYEYYASGITKTCAYYKPGHELYYQYTYLYDENDSYQGKILKYGTGAEYHYNADNKCTKQISSNGNYYVYEYTPGGNRKIYTYFLKDKSGDDYYYRYEYLYDENEVYQGRILRYASGYEYHYNAENKIIKCIYSNGNYLVYEYTAGGNYKTYTYYMKGFTGDDYYYRYEYLYDEGDIYQGRILSYANGTEYHYNKDNKQTYARYSNGNYIIYEYTPSGKTLTYTYYLKDKTGDDYYYRYEYLYDENEIYQGKVIKYASGYEYYYNKDNRCTKRIYSNGNYLLYEYTASGKILTYTYYVEDALYYRYEYLYDENEVYQGKILKYASGYEYYYNKDNRCTKRIYSNGNYLLYEYTASGKMLTYTYYMEDTFYYRYEYLYDENEVYQGKILKYASGYEYYYNKDNRCTKRIYSNGNYLLYEYTASGKLLTNTYYLVGNEGDDYYYQYTYQYDENEEYQGRILKYSDGKEYHYNKDNKIVYIQYANGYYYIYEYNDDKTIKKSTYFRPDDSKNSEYEYFYENGIRIKYTLSYYQEDQTSFYYRYTYLYDAAGTFTGRILQYSNGREYHYDNEYRIIKKLHTDGTSETWEYTEPGSTEVKLHTKFDAGNRVIYKKHLSGQIETWEYWNATGMLVKKKTTSDPDTTQTGDEVAWEYDTQGSIIKITYDDGAWREIDYFYNKSWKDEERYYDPSGNLMHKIEYRYNEDNFVDKEIYYYENGNMKRNIRYKSISSTEKDYEQYYYENEICRLDIRYFSDASNVVQRKTSFREDGTKDYEEEFYNNQNNTSKYFRYYDEDGDVYRHISYWEENPGEVYAEILYYKNGKNKYYVQYFDNSQNSKAEEIFYNNDGVEILSYVYFEEAPNGIRREEHSYSNGERKIFIEYFNNEQNSLKNKKLFNENGHLTETRQYWEEYPNVIKAIGFTDPDPGEDGDIVSESYDELGRLTTLGYDNWMTASLLTYWGDSANRLKQEFFDINGVWSSSVRYESDGQTVAHAWSAGYDPKVDDSEGNKAYDRNENLIAEKLEDPDPNTVGDVVYVEYDSLGRIIYKELDNGNYHEIDYWFNEPWKDDERFYDPDGNLIYEIDYYHNETNAKIDETHYYTDGTKKQYISYNYTLPGIKTYEYYYHENGNDKQYIKYFSNSSNVKQYEYFYHESGNADYSIYYFNDQAHSIKGYEYFDIDGDIEKVVKYFEADPSVVEAEFHYYKNGNNEYRVYYYLNASHSKEEEEFFNESGIRIHEIDYYEEAPNGKRYEDFYWDNGEDKRRIHYFNNALNSLDYETLFDENGDWIEYIEYWEDYHNVIKERRIEDINPNVDGDIENEYYDTLGRLIEAEYDNWKTASLVTYWGDSFDKLKEEFFDLEEDWRNSIRYEQDGIAVAHAWSANYDPRTDDSDGNKAYDRLERMIVEKRANDDLLTVEYWDETMKFKKEILYDAFDVLLERREYRDDGIAIWANLLQDPDPAVDGDIIYWEKDVLGRIWKTVFDTGESIERDFMGDTENVRYEEYYDADSLMTRRIRYSPDSIGAIHYEYYYWPNGEEKKQIYYFENEDNQIFYEYFYSEDGSTEHYTYYLDNDNHSKKYEYYYWENGNTKHYTYYLDNGNNGKNYERYYYEDGKTAHYILYFDNVSNGKERETYYGPSGDTIATNYYWEEYPDKLKKSVITDTDTNVPGDIVEKNYNEKGEIINEVYDTGEWSEYTYYDTGELKTKTYSTQDADNVKAYTYDKEGRVIEKLFGDNTKETIEYWAAGDTKVKTRSTYDSSGNLIETLGYYEDGTTLKSRIVPDADPSQPGDIVEEQYDVGGKLIKEVYDTGEYIASTYYDTGELKTKTYSTPDADNVKTYTYDKEGRVIEKLYSDNTKETLEYWAAGDTKVKTRSTHDSSGALIVTLGYYEDGTTLKSRIVPDADPSQPGDIVEEQYDVDGKLIKEILDTGEWSGYTYYDTGELKTKTLSSPDANNVKTYTYDKEGRVIEKLYADNTKETLEYWTAGDTKVKTRSTYDASGDLVETLGYHEDGTTLKSRIVADSDPANPGDIIETNYNLKSEIIKVIYDTGEWEEYTYYATGELNTKTLSTPDADNVKTYTYDKEGRVIEKLYADNTKETLEYWTAGDAKVKTRSTYDASGDLVETLGYHEDGTTLKSRIVADADPANPGDIIETNYNLKSEIIKVIYDTGEWEGYTYYDTGELNTKTFSTPDANNVKTYTYDKEGRVIEKLFADKTKETREYWSDGSDKVKLYTMYASGDVWQETIEYLADGVTKHRHWILDADPNNTGDLVEYEYDAEERLVVRIYDDTSRDTWEYWAAGSDKVKKYSEFGPDFSWLETTEYWEDGETKHRKWVPDADPNNTGDPVEYGYDTEERLILRLNDDTSRQTWEYWAAGSDKIKTHAIFGPDFTWQETTEYWEDGITRHKRWIPDADPNQSGDIVEEQFDLDGKLIKEIYDIGEWEGYTYYDTGELETRTYSSPDAANVKTYTYDKEGRVIEKLYADNTKETLEYWASGDIKVKTRSAYEASGDLIETLGYYEDGTTLKSRIVSDADPANPGDVVEEHYNAAGEAIKEVYDTGEWEEYTYYATGELNTKTFSTPDANNVKTYTYDKEGRVIEKLYIDNTKETLEYWAAGDTKVKTRSTYDSSGSLIETLGYYEDGTTLKNRIIPDADPAQPGDVVEEQYSEEGKIIEEIYDTGEWSEFTYYATGELKTKTYSTSDINNVKTYTYDKEGRVIEKLYADNTKEILEYWAAGDIKVKMRSTYDSTGRLIETLGYYEDGTTLKSRIVPDADPAQPGDIVEEQYNVDGKLIKEIDDTGEWEEYTYYDTGELETKTLSTPDANNVKIYTYDKEGRVIEKLYADNTKETLEYWTAGDAKVKTRSAYDASGDLVEALGYHEDGTTLKSRIVPDADPANPGDIIETNYNLQSEVVKVIYDTGEWEGYTYFATGELNTKTFSTPDANNVKTYTYDKEGRVTEKLYADNAKETLEYWAAGDTKIKTRSIYDSVGGLIETLGYFEDGTTLKSRIVPDVDPANPGDVVEEHYNAAGELIKEIYDTGEWEEYTYYDTGELETKKLSTPDVNNVKTYTYDKEGRVIEKLYADDTKETLEYWAAGSALVKTRSTYDASGNLVETLGYHEDGTTLKSRIVPDADPANPGDIIEEQYSQEGKLLKEIYDTGEWSEFTYYATGELKTKTYSTEDANNVKTYTYDKEGRVIEKLYADNTKETLEYWAAGDTKVKTRSAYDAAGDLIEALGYYDDGTTLKSRTVPDADPANPGDVVEEHYNTAGEVIKEIYDTGEWERYTYYDTGELETRTYSNSDADNVKTYTYDKEGRVIEKLYADNTKETLEYWAAGDTKARTRTTYDSSGSMIETLGYYEDGTTLKSRIVPDIDPAQPGDTVEEHYDLSGDLIKEVYDTGDYVLYAYYSQSGRMHTKAFLDGRVEEYSDEDPQVLIVIYNYSIVDQGRLLNKTDLVTNTTFYYYDDLANRLREKTDSSGTGTYYNSTGNYIESLTLNEADAQGNIYYHYLDEDWASQGHGRIDKLIMGALVEGVLAYTYEYYDDINGRLKTRTSYPNSIFTEPSRMITYNNDANSNILSKEDITYDSSNKTSTHLTVYDTSGSRVSLEISSFEQDGTVATSDTYEYGAPKLTRRTYVIYDVSGNTTETITYPRSVFSETSDHTLSYWVDGVEYTEDITLQIGDNAITRNITGYDDYSVVLEWDIEYDRPGADGTIAINSDAEYTNSLDVTLSLTAFGTPLPVEMRFSTDDGATWTDWETIASAKNLTLPEGDGTKTVTYQINDAEGKVAEYTDTIMLDTIAPALGLLSDAYVYDDDYVLNYRVMDANLETSIKTENITLSRGINTITRQFQDEIGNVREMTWNIYLDLNAERGITYDYDVVGNLVRQTTFNGQDIEFEYDDNYRLTAHNYPEYPGIEITYNDIDEITRTTDARGNTDYTYDIVGMLKSVTLPDGQILNYSYDLTGRITQFSYAGRTINYAYDDAGNLTSVTEGTSTTTYSYNVAGDLIFTTLPNGIRTSYTYDDAGNITEVRHEKVVPAAGEDPEIVTLVSDFTYTLNASGQRIQMIETTPEGARTVDYTFDDFSRLIQETDSLHGTMKYTYDNAGNRLSKEIIPLVVAIETPREVTQYSYGTDNRLTGLNLKTFDSTGSELANTLETFTYDAAGNIRQRITPDNVYYYEFDSRNFLVRFNDGANETTYEYDGGGNRVSKTVNGDTTNYLIDPVSIIPQVLAEMNETGDITKSYAYGLKRLSSSAGSEDEYYLQDGLGSSVGIADASGAMSEIYSYDAFGNPQFSGASQNFLYSGEQRDDESGLIYLRARYYDPSLGRFISRDPAFIGKQDETQSLNPFIYVQNDPVNYVDPTGNVLISVATLTTLGVIALAGACAISISRMSRRGNPLPDLRQYESSPSGMPFKMPDWNPRGLIAFTVGLIVIKVVLPHARLLLISGGEYVQRELTEQDFRNMNPGIWADPDNDLPTDQNGDSNQQGSSNQSYWDNILNDNYNNYTGGDGPGGGGGFTSGLGNDYLITTSIPGTMTFGVLPILIVLEAVLLVDWEMNSSVVYLEDHPSTIQVEFIWIRHCRLRREYKGYSWG